MLREVEVISNPSRAGSNLGARCWSPIFSVRLRPMQLSGLKLLRRREEAQLPDEGKRDRSDRSEVVAAITSLRESRVERNNTL